MIFRSLRKEVLFWFERHIYGMIGISPMLPNHKSCFPLLAALFLAYIGCGAEVFHVDRDFQGENPTGESWLSAFPTLQGAIDAAAAAGGGEIWVKAGVHKPDGESRNATIEIKPGVSIYGGFRGNETDREQRNPKLNRTVLTGDIGKIVSSSDNSYHVLTGASDIRIDGFTISRGNANAAGEHRFGGGLRLPAKSRNVTVANCTFEKNSAETGGAIHAQDAELTATNCTFYANSGETGGALAVAGKSNLRLTDCTFSSGFAPKGGGAIHLLTGTDATIERSSFLFNSTDGRGGALLAETDQKGGIRLGIGESVFRENVAKQNGGALAFKGAFAPIVANSIFEKNSSSRGAGAIANESGVAVYIPQNTFTANRGATGKPDIGSDTASRVVKSAKEATKLVGSAATKPAEAPKAMETPKPAPQPKRKLADVYVHNPQDIKVKLRSILATADCTVLALGDLTDPVFLSNYRNIEAAARDYAPKGVRFHYIYRYLAHPGNHGYVPPFKQQERARQVKIAEESLFTQVPWLYDAMDNQTAHELMKGNNANLFIFSGQGEELFSGSIEDVAALRNALATRAGKADIPTNADALPKPNLNPIALPEISLTQGVAISAADHFQPLEITPLDSKSPHFVKLRAEGNKSLLESGNGKLYLRFCIDPLYQVEWNNFADPMKYELKVSGGVVAPSIGTAQRVTEKASDTEPREFMLEARKLDISKPVNLQVTYSILSAASRSNAEVVQQYIVYLQQDRFGGEVYGHQTPLSQSTATASSGGSGESAFAMFLRRFDLDRNGKLSSDEAIGRLRSNFTEIDTNQDGYVDETEFLKFRETR
jgi:predicted outer membrane repeat protein